MLAFKKIYMFTKAVTKHTLILLNLSVSSIVRNRQNFPSVTIRLT